MYDNIYTSYNETPIFINSLNAPDVISVMEERMYSSAEMTAEKYCYLSKAYIFMQNDEMALKYAKLAIEKEETYVYGYVRAAFAYARMGDRDNTLQYLTIADRLNLFYKNDLITTFLIMLYDFCKEKRKSKQLKNELIKNYKNCGEYAYYMGFIYHQNEPDKAIEWFQKAEELGYKDKFNLWTNIADNYELLEDYKNAEIYVDKCLSYGESNFALRLKADCLKERQEYLEAAKYWKLKYKKFDDTLEKKTKTLAMIIYAYSLSEQSYKCKKYIDFATKYFESEYTLNYVSASYFENEGDYQRAIELYKRNLLLDDTDSGTYTSISYCYSQIGNSKLALEYADEAIINAPQESYGYYRKGRALANMKEYERAITLFEKSIDYDKTDVDSFQWLSYCYSMLKNYDKSLEYANRAILIDKTDGYSYFRKAWAYQEMGRYREAINFYKECIKYNDRYVDAYLNISFIYSKIKDIKQSLLYANKALLINKDYAYAHYRKAWALQESGRLGEALDGYSKAIELNPTDIYNYLGIACISLNTNESETALLYANKALFIDRTCGGAYYYKSLALSNLGKIKESEAAYHKAIELGYTPS